MFTVELHYKHIDAVYRYTTGRIFHAMKTVQWLISIGAPADEIKIVGER